MTMLANVEKNHAPLTLVDYEARIYLYKEQIGTGYIGIGRTLNEAKAAKVVPHGQWESWVEQTTGMNIQSAQRCMKAAREIKDGSALAQLEMSKALALLSSGLDEDTREGLAQQAVDESESLAALREEIKKKQTVVDQVIAAQQKTAARAAKAEKQAFENAEKLKEAQEQADELARAAREYSEDADKHCRRANEARQECAQLRDQLRDVEEKAMTAARAALAGEVEAATEAARKEIDELRADLEAAERREEKKAQQLQALRDEQNQRAMDSARGVATSGFKVFDLAAAVRAFIGSAGVLPQMGETLRGIAPAERRTMLENVETVAQWVDGARLALGVVDVDADGLKKERR